MKGKAPATPFIFCLFVLTCLALQGCGIFGDNLWTGIPNSAHDHNGYDFVFQSDKNVLRPDSEYHYSLGKEQALGKEQSWKEIEINGAPSNYFFKEFGTLALRLKMTDGRAYNEEIDLPPLIKKMKKNYDIVYFLNGKASFTSPPPDPGPLKKMIAKQYEEHMRQYGFSWYASTDTERVAILAGHFDRDEEEEMEAWAVAYDDPFYKWGVDLHDGNAFFVTRFPDRIRVTISKNKLKIDYILKLGRYDDPYLKQARQAPDRPLAKECLACLQGAPASDWQPRTPASPPRKCANDKCYIQERYSAEYPIPLYEKPLN